MKKTIWCNDYTTNFLEIHGLIKSRNIINRITWQSLHPKITVQHPQNPFWGWNDTIHIDRKLLTEIASGAAQKIVFVEKYDQKAECFLPIVVKRTNDDPSYLLGLERDDEVFAPYHV